MIGSLFNSVRYGSTIFQAAESLVKTIGFFPKRFHTNMKEAFPNYFPFEDIPEQQAINKEELYLNLSQLALFGISSARLLMMDEESMLDFAVTLGATSLSMYQLAQYAPQSIKDSVKSTTQQVVDTVFHKVEPFKKPSAG